METEAEEKPPTTLTPPLSEWDRLHEDDRQAWLKRCDAAIAVISPMFKPRAVHLKYCGPYRAFLTLLGEGNTLEVGEINLAEPM